MGKWIDKWLADVGLERRDLRYNFTWKGKRYYIPTFNPLWWIVATVSTVGCAVVLYTWVVLMILVFG